MMLKMYSAAHEPTRQNFVWHSNSMATCRAAGSYSLFELAWYKVRIHQMQKRAIRNNKETQMTCWQGSLEPMAMVRHHHRP